MLFNFIEPNVFAAFQGFVLNKPAQLRKVHDFEIILLPVKISRCQIQGGIHFYAMVQFLFQAIDESHRVIIDSPFAYRAIPDNISGGHFIIKNTIVKTFHRKTGSHIYIDIIIFDINKCSGRNLHMNVTVSIVVLIFDVSIFKIQQAPVCMGN